MPQNCRRLSALARHEVTQVKNYMTMLCHQISEIYDITKVNGAINANIYSQEMNKEMVMRDFMFYVIFFLS